MLIKINYFDKSIALYIMQDILRGLIAKNAIGFVMGYSYMIVPLVMSLCIANLNQPIKSIFWHLFGALISTRQASKPKLAYMLDKGVDFIQIRSWEIFQLLQNLRAKMIHNPHY